MKALGCGADIEGSVQQSQGNADIHSKLGISIATQHDETRAEFHPCQCKTSVHYHQYHHTLDLFHSRGGIRKVGLMYCYNSDAVGSNTRESLYWYRHVELAIIETKRIYHDWQET
mgnify:CR=1 FL=1